MRYNWDYWLSVFLSVELWRLKFKCWLWIPSLLPTPSVGGGGGGGGVGGGFGGWSVRGREEEGGGGGGRLVSSRAWVRNSMFLSRSSLPTRHYDQLHSKWIWHHQKERLGRVVRSVSQASTGLYVGLALRRSSTSEEPRRRKQKWVVPREKLWGWPWRDRLVIGVWVG